MQQSISVIMVSQSAPGVRLGKLCLPKLPKPFSNWTHLAPHIKFYKFAKKLSSVEKLWPFWNIWPSSKSECCQSSFSFMGIVITYGLSILNMWKSKTQTKPPGKKIFSSHFLCPFLHVFKWQGLHFHVFSRVALFLKFFFCLFLSSLSFENIFSA